MSGKPIKAPQPSGGRTGGLGWAAPTGIRHFSPRTKLFYVTSWEDYHTPYFTWDQEYEAGKSFTGGTAVGPFPSIKREPFIKWDESWGYGVVRALNPLNGEKVWDYKMRDVSDAGILTTGSDCSSPQSRGLLLRTRCPRGKELWKRYLGGGGRFAHHLYGGRGQHVSIAAGHSLFTFALRK
jgi:hypothetical protein